MEILRTPDERFTNLPDFPFAPRYRDVANPAGPQLRVHYLDEGSPDAAPVLLLHGEPSWCYLYRRMIPPLVSAGHRVLAPDLIGFGRSDKPARRDDYTFERHVDWMSDWLTQLDLQNVTLFCQDWGGLIGLRLVARFPERFAAVVAANTGLPEGGKSAPLAFRLWLAFSQYVPRLPIGWLISKGCVRGLGPAEQRAYDAPFPTSATRLVPGSSRRWCRSRTHMRRSPNARPPGAFSSGSTNHSSRLSPIAIPSRADWIACCRRAFPAPPVSRTKPFAPPAIFFRKTNRASWRRRSTT